MSSLIQTMRLKQMKMRKWKKTLPEAEPSFSQIEKSADPIQWIEQNFFIPERKDFNPPAIQLAPYQKAVLREACRQDENGKFIYNIVVWSDIKKSAKSSISAAIALYRAYHLEWGNIKIIANDLKQADSRAAYYLRRAMDLNPLFVKGENYKAAGYKITLPNQTIIEAIPIDPAGEAGGNDDLLVFSELWAAKHKAIQQMWTELTISPNKFGYSQRWIETYAGFSGESPILESLYERGVQNGTQLDLSTDETDLSDLEVYREGDMLCLWNTTPRLEWQTPEYYKSEAAVLLPSEFNRIHRNQWGSSVEKFIETLWWDNCKGNVNTSPGQSVVIALDAAEGSEKGKSDCFVMLMVGKQGDTVEVLYCGIWQAEHGYIDQGPIEQELERLLSIYSVIEVAYDPYQLHNMATRFRNEGKANFKRFNQGAERLTSDKQLRDLIIAKRVRHDGNPLLRQHIDNANIKNHGESGIRLIKRNPNLKIDAAVTLSMAANRILYYNL